MVNFVLKHCILIGQCCLFLLILSKTLFNSIYGYITTGGIQISLHCISTAVDQKSRSQIYKLSIILSSGPSQVYPYMYASKVGWPDLNEFDFRMNFDF